MTVLVCGGAGYIGSHTVVELLKAGHNPIIVDDLSNSKAEVVDKIEIITGKRADIIFIKTDKIHLCPENDVSANIVYSANGADIDTVIIDGKVVMQNRKMTNIDEKEVIKQVKKVAKRLL